MTKENHITPDDIIAMVREQIVLPGDGWDVVMYKVEKGLATEWGFTLETKLVEE